MSSPLRTVLSLESDCPPSILMDPEGPASSAAVPVLRGRVCSVTADVCHCGRTRACCGPGSSQCRPACLGVTLCQPAPFHTAHGHSHSRGRYQVASKHLGHEDAQSLVPRPHRKCSLQWCAAQVQNIYVLTDDRAGLNPTCAGLVTLGVWSL